MKKENIFEKIIAKLKIKSCVTVIKEWDSKLPEDIVLVLRYTSISSLILVILLSASGILYPQSSSQKLAELRTPTLGAYINGSSINQKLIGSNNNQNEEIEEISVANQNIDLEKALEVGKFEITTVDEITIDLLARLIMVEAKDEPFIAQIALAAVMVNRSTDERFPKDIASNIYRIADGSLVNSKEFWKSPDSRAIKAAKEAVLGIDPTEGAIYYANAEIDLEASLNQDGKTIIKIGNLIFSN